MALLVVGVRSSSYRCAASEEEAKEAYAAAVGSESLGVSRGSERWYLVTRGTQVGVFKGW